MEAQNPALTGCRCCMGFAGTSGGQSGTLRGTNPGLYSAVPFIKHKQWGHRRKRHARRTFPAVLHQNKHWVHRNSCRLLAGLKRTQWCIELAHLLTFFSERAHRWARAHKSCGAECCQAGMAHSTAAGPTPTDSACNMDNVPMQRWGHQTTRQK